MRTQSQVSLLAGGVAFDVPSVVTATGPADEDNVFTLFGTDAARINPTATSRPKAVYAWPKSV